MFWLQLHNEFIKLKSTLALWMALLMPLAIVLLTTLLMLNKPSTTTIDGGMFAMQSIAFWAILIQPMYIAIVGVLVLGLEHKSHGWQRLYVMPISKLSVYFSKLSVMLFLQFAAIIVLALLTLSSMYLLSSLGHLSLNQFDLIAFISAMLRTVLAALVVLGVQHWLSTRWSNFVAPLIVAVAATLTVPSVASSERFWKFDPWTYGLVAAATKDPSAQTIAIGLSVALAIIVVTIGAWDVSRRELH